MARDKHSARDRHVAKLAKMVSVTHTAEGEDTPIEGSFAYGDDAEDKRMEEHVRATRRRSLWGWCCVKTTVEYAGFRGVTYLGCCSYESADAFVADQGAAQTFEACAALLDNLIEAKHAGIDATAALRKIRSR